MLTFLQKLERYFLHLFWIFPVNSKRIVFFCYNCTQYSCNPKYISIRLKKEYPDQFEQVWFYENDKVRMQLPEYVKKYKKNSIGYFFNILTAKYIITNVTLPRVTPFRSNQVRINTWHGTAFKGDTNQFYNDYNQNNYFLAENQLTHNVLRLQNSFNYQGEILNIGMPRNDMLIKVDEHLINDVRVKLHLKVDAKVVLYAPTFRNSGNVECFNIDFDDLVKVLEEQFGGKWIVLCRYHHMQNGKIKNDKGIDVSEYPDMQELLLTSDMLITDYSSSMWDFSLMYKPIFLYAPDIEQYISHERGDFFFPLERLPFPIARSNSELFDVIKNFENDKYIHAVNSYQALMGRYNFEGNATDKLVELILNR